MGIELNIYATPAALSLLLLIIETVFLFVTLPETRNLRPAPKSRTVDQGNQRPAEDLGRVGQQRRLNLLNTLRHLHFLFLSIFSGVEFTLTFLTFDRKSLCMLY